MLGRVEFLKKDRDVVGKRSVLSTKYTGIRSSGPGCSRNEMSSGFESSDVSANM